MALQIVQPAANSIFNIDATPRMPTIRCQARITGIQPDPTPATRLQWSIAIVEQIQASTCPSSRRGNCTLNLAQQNVVGGTWTPNLVDIQGGDAVISVQAVVQGANLQASIQVRVRGTNPAAATITARLGGAGTAADRIACHESGRRQFNAAGTPLLGPGGDVGIMQLCNPAASCIQRWGWTDNVDAGRALMSQKQTIAQHHLNSHQVQGHYPNDQNLDDAAVLLRETIQRYNGGAYWKWNGSLSRWEAHPPNEYVTRVLACQ
jgi:hypothetical protein